MSDCWYCGAPAEHTDHMIPVSKGGSFLNDKENCVSACTACNLGKGAMSVQLFRERIARLLGLDDWQFAGEIESRKPHDAKRRYFQGVSWLWFTAADIWPWVGPTTWAGMCLPTSRTDLLLGFRYQFNGFPKRELGEVFDVLARDPHCLDRFDIAQPIVTCIYCRKAFDPVLFRTHRGSEGCGRRRGPLVELSNLH